MNEMTRYLQVKRAHPGAQLEYRTITRWDDEDGSPQERTGEWQYGTFAYHSTVMQGMERFGPIDMIITTGVEKEELSHGS